MKAEMKSILSKRVYDMTDRELRIYKKYRARQNRVKRFLIRLFSLIALVSVLTIAGRSLTTKADNADKAHMCKYYRNVSIGYGDTIESIAIDNFDEEYYKSYEAFEKEIREINHISKDTAIVGGEIIFIPYYSEIH